MPSRSDGVTLLFRYWRAGAPCSAASAGIVAAGSGWADAARDPLPPPAPVSPGKLRIGVDVRTGRGEGALLLLFSAAAGAVEVAGPVGAGVAVEDG